MITFIQTILHKSLWSNIYNGEGRVLFQGFSVGWWKHYTDSSGRKQVFSKPWDSGEFSIIKDWKPFFINLKRGNPEVIPSKDSRFADPCQSLLIFAMPAWGIFFFWLRSGYLWGAKRKCFLEGCFKRPTEREVSLVDLNDGSRHAERRLQRSETKSCVTRVVQDGL